MPPRVVLAGFLPVAVFVALAAHFQGRNAVTYDEPTYSDLAAELAARGDFTPLARAGVAPLPILLTHLPVHLTAPPDCPRVERIELARALAAGLFGVPLVLLVGGWVYAGTRSAGAAAAAGLLAAASPTLVAHGSVATTDACFTLWLMAAGWAVGRHAARPTAGRLLLAGLAVGLAVSAKYSGLLLLPAGYAVGLLADRTGASPPGWRRQLWRAGLVLPARVAGIALITAAVVWAVAGFSFSTNPLLPAHAGPRGPVGDWFRSARPPTPVHGLLTQSGMSAATNDFFPTRLLGRQYPDGHRLYYAAAVLFKSTPVELGLLVAAVGLGAARLVRRTGRPPDLGLATAGLATGLLFLTVSLSAKQYGLRYVLPVYPLLVIGVVTAV